MFWNSEPKLTKTAVVVADNVGMFRKEVTPYLDRVKKGGGYTSEIHDFGTDAVEVSRRTSWALRKKLSSLLPRSGGGGPRALRARAGGGADAREISARARCVIGGASGGQSCRGPTPSNLPPQAEEGFVYAGSVSAPASVSSLKPPMLKTDL
jgi:hypothetical protein